MLTSLERGGIGFLIAIAIGTPLGLLLAEWRLLRRALGPLLSGLQVLPSVAWVPAAILWFGLSDATVYFVILMGAIPSIANGLVSGIDQVPPQLRRVGTVLGANRGQLATLVVLPAAMPGYFAGLKQGWAFSWRSLMAAEIITMGGTIGFGLGSMLQQSRELADLSAVLATILVILVIGILVELVVFAPIETTPPAPPGPPPRRHPMTTGRARATAAPARPPEHLHSHMIQHTPKGPPMTRSHPASSPSASRSSAPALPASTPATSWPLPCETPVARRASTCSTRCPPPTA